MSTYTSILTGSVYGCLYSSLVIITFVIITNNYNNYSSLFSTDLFKNNLVLHSMLKSLWLVPIAFSIKDAVLVP